MLEKQIKDAIIQNQVETLKDLLTDNEGAANLTLDTSEPPLNTVKHSNTPQAVKLMSEHRANPNLETYSPLQLALSTKAPRDIIILLLEHKAIIGENTDHILNIFKTALQANENSDKIYLCIKNHCIDSIDPIKLLLWIIELNPKVEDNVQKILTNVLICLLDKHQTILNRTADQKSKLLVGEAVLFSAVKSGNDGMVELLLQHKVILNCYDEKGFHPLHRAAETTNINVAKVLIAARANVNVKAQKTKNRPLFQAVSKGNIQLVQLLIEEGADINAPNDMSNSTLRAAIYGGHVEIAMLLMAHGADIHELYYGEHILVTAAEKTNSSDLIKKLIEKGADVNCASYLSIPSRKMYPLIRAVEQRHHSVVTTLLEYGANPNVKIDDGSSPLHHAINRGFVDIAKALIAYGADINAQDQNNSSPLHCAMSKEAIKLLLDEGVRLTIDSKIFHLPLPKCIAMFKIKNQGNEVAIKALEEMINNYINKPRSLMLLAKCCIRDRLIKSSSDTSTTETFRQKTAKLGLPRILKWYVESVSMNTNTVDDGSNHETISNCDTPQLAAQPRLQPVSTRTRNSNRISCPLRPLSRLCSGGCIRDRSVRHEPGMSQPDVPATEHNLAAQPDLYPAFEISPYKSMRM